MMTSLLTFYLSRIIGNKILSENGESFGRIQDLLVDVGSIRPKVIAAKIKSGNKSRLVDFTDFIISKEDGQYLLKCSIVKEIETMPDNTLFLVRHILDKQIVDMDGKKVVRVNDVRLAVLSNGVYVIAVDVGIEGLLRRLGVAKPVKNMLKPFGKNIPSNLILWEEVETVDVSHAGIKLSKAYSKLSTLHPSDLADIIEELDIKTQAAVFASFDEERAADVLEELDADAQKNVLGSMTVERAADVLEKMPADEIADILDEIEEDKAEELLSEMETEASEEVRELMEYPDNSVGSIMTTDYISFNENLTINETINELRKLKPESDTIYYLYVIDDEGRLVAVVSLRDIIVSEPEIKLNQIMKTEVIYVYDDDNVDILAGIIAKYSLFAIPVVDSENKILGMVIINDIVHSLLKSRKKRL